MTLLLSHNRPLASQPDLRPEERAAVRRAIAAWLVGVIVLVLAAVVLGAVAMAPLAHA